MRQKHSISSVRAGLILLLVFTVAALNSCKVAHMALPEGMLNDSTEMAVEGRAMLIIKKTMSFGPYQVVDVNRGWTRGRSLSFGGYNSSGAEQKYEFTLKEPGMPSWQAQCTTGADWSKLKGRGLFGGTFSVEFSSKRNLACELKKKDSEYHNEVELRDRLAQPSQDIVPPDFICFALSEDVHFHRKINNSSRK